MASAKITMTLPEGARGGIRERVATGEFDSVSAFVARVAESMRDIELLDLLVAGMVAESGEPDEQAKAWVDAAIEKAGQARYRESPEDAQRAGRAA